MNTEWSLSGMYAGLDDPRYQEDLKQIDVLTAQLNKLVEKTGSMDQREAAVEILKTEEQMVSLLGKVGLYVGLRLAVDTANPELAAQDNLCMKKYAVMAKPLTSAKKFLAKLPEEVIAADEFLSEYSYLLAETKKEVSHLLDDEMEELISSMDMTGGSAWARLFTYLTSTVKVDYEGKTVTLSEIRNMAYSPDKTVRKTAYEAELVSYEKIQDSIAYALNNIKSQVTMLCRKRGYASPLEMTLEQSRMSKKTLEAMLEAMQEYLPKFHQYLRAKGKALGHENGLPWYDLFAPMGASDKRYSLEECRDLLIQVFSGFSEEMSGMMRRAFDESWIDFYPREGKEGGAFDAFADCLKQSRILTNYDGYFGDVDTLAHELGHAFHDRQIEYNRPLNQEYSMPVAETASTFNETHLLKAMLKESEGEEKLNLLESFLMNTTQIICDIYSRYLFETAVFEKCEDSFMMPDQLKEIMLDAQKKAYGDGLDQSCLHPYMWACKGHYYSSGLSFYNFPYAFGGLFAMGLYHMYEQEGSSFVPKYKAMLKATPTASIEEAAAMMGADLTKADFWRESLQAFAELIDEFCEICG